MNKLRAELVIGRVRREHICSVLALPIVIRIRQQPEHEEVAKWIPNDEVEVVRMLTKIIFVWKIKVYYDNILIKMTEHSCVNQE